MIGHVEHVVRAISSILPTPVIGGVGTVVGVEPIVNSKNDDYVTYEEALGVTEEHATDSYPDLD